MTDACVVIWRASPRTPWAVQPRLHPAALAARIAGQLVDQFGGEAQALPITILTAEDPKD